MNEKLSCEEDRQQQQESTLRRDSTKKGPNPKGATIFRTSFKGVKWLMCKPFIDGVSPFFFILFLCLTNLHIVHVCVSVCTGMECICVASHSRYHVTEFGDGGGDDDDVDDDL